MARGKVTPRSRAAWREWLEKNFSSAHEVWVVFYKRHTGKDYLRYDEAVEEALCFGWIDGIIKSIDAERYMHRFSPRKANSRWSEVNKKRARRLIDAGLMTAAGQRLIDTAKRSGTWNRPQPTTVDAEIPGEFAAALRKNRKALKNFEKLTAAQQRHYTGWIASAKRQSTRARRIDEAIELLRRGEKLGMR